MKPILIEPRDPLIARDGRPFKAGQRAKTLEFPLPSTTSGAIRTRSGSNAEGEFVQSPQTVKGWEVRGPILINPVNHMFYAPAPLDSLMVDSKQLHPLSPLQLDDQTSTNLEYAPVGTRTRLEGKAKGMPKYWCWNHFAKWLLEAHTQTIKPETLGIPGPTLETRTHVKIEPGSQTAEQSQLFSTSGLEFIHVPKLTPSKRHETLQHAERLALYLETNSGKTTNHDLWSVGGERRLSRWETESTPEHPQLSGELLDRIKLAKACRVILLTPAYFKQGWKPEHLLGDRHGAAVKLIAAAVGRPQVVSGWDYAHVGTDANGRIVRGQPKPTRRLAPAGSVYFLRLEGDIENWCRQTWWQNISDEEDGFFARKDGFGLCVLGMWNGILEIPNLQEVR